MPDQEGPCGAFQALDPWEPEGESPSGHPTLFNEEGPTFGPEGWAAVRNERPVLCLEQTDVSSCRSHRPVRIALTHPGEPTIKSGATSLQSTLPLPASTSTVQT